MAKKTITKTKAKPKENFKSGTLWTRDNLEIMRGLNSHTVDLIYLDPPFNSNRNYAAPIDSKAAGAAFKDTWTLSDVDNAWHGEIADKDPAVYQAISASELTHGKGMKSYLIMMAVRLLEMKRLLKPTGSIYLHCDPTASHYLKLLMDAVFGRAWFRNEISWRRSHAHGDTNFFGKICDQIFLYSGAKSINKDGVRVPLNQGYIEKAYRYKDHRGLYQPTSLTTKGLTGGGYDYEFHGHWGPWRYNQTKMLEIEADGRIHLPKKGGGMPRFKRYISENKGQIPDNIWTDITIAGKQERVGYPTQKPLSLMERIIKASSSEGDLALDPFCGCATTLIAAEKLKRRWLGIDLSIKAADLVKLRMVREADLIDRFNLIHREDLPRRTDLRGKPVNYRTHRHELFGKQEGRCNGCGHSFPFRNFTLDHIVPQDHGGSDHIANLQLLCGACNSTKGVGTQAQLLAKLKKLGLID